MNEVRYIPHTADDTSSMLRRLNLRSVDELFADIPPAARLARPLDLPGALDEMTLTQQLTALAGENLDVQAKPCFLGGGYYDRFIPAAVGTLASRSEFVTSYTPYQAELSQGTLAAIFEFQSMIQVLTGTYAAQASLYDGASAVGEAVLLALSQQPNRHRIVILRGVHPDSVMVARTYTHAHQAEVLIVDTIEECVQTLDSGVAAVLLQYPDMLGYVVHMADLISRAHREGVLVITATDPIALAILKPPGEFGADIVVGEGQPLGNRLGYGGPTLGFFAVQEPLVRKLPGRLVGATHDDKGQRGFVLTLQAREQHIRRDKATSNICSNHSLNALMSTIYMALLGPQGLREVAYRSAQAAHYLAQRLADIGLMRCPGGPFLYEFAVRVPGDIEDLNRHLLNTGIIGGFPMGRWDPQWTGLWQLAVTERRTRTECDQLVEEVSAWMCR